MGGESQQAASSQPAATTGQQQAAANFLDPSFSENGKFREGWAKTLDDAGFPRLAKKGMAAPDERTFLKSLDDTLQFVGKKAGHLPPGEGSTPEEIAEYRKQVGAPDDITGYKFKPEKLPDGIIWDEAGTGDFLKLAHDHNIPAAFMEKAGEVFTKTMESWRDKGREMFDNAIAEKSTESARVFKEEWGLDYDTRLQSNKDWAKAVGFNPAEDPMDARILSDPRVVRLLDANRREARGVLPGNGGEMTNSMGAEQTLQKYMTDNPQWERNADQHRRVTELSKLVAAERERRR